jgi:hypothetical protein
VHLMPHEWHGYPKYRTVLDRPGFPLAARAAGRVRPVLRYTQPGSFGSTARAIANRLQRGKVGLRN